jgi:cytochrome c oxidase subunit 2
LCSKKHAVVLAALLPAAGCSGVQSALDPAGPAAQHLANLTWALLIGATAILAIVMLLAAYAVFRDPDRRRRISSNALIVGGGIVFPVLVLGALLVYGVWLTGALRASEAGDALQVRVTAHMWWWEVHYPASQEGDIVATANEIRIPVGRPVSFTLSSPDVIHSFWVPTLSGKIDVIPGRTTRLTFSAERPGVYRGQCAEFCGAQHALMAFHVVALEPQAFDRWLADQRKPAQAPASAAAKTGQDAFIAQACGNCHTVRGVVDSRIAGPDLTHLASRAWIGAGALANTRDGLVRWIAHGDAVKPGRAMPSYAHLDEATLGALAEYLSGLE